VILDEPAVRAIADLLGSEVHKAPFEVPKLGRGHEGQPATESGPVFQVSIRGQEMGEPLLLTLWPSLSRVDVRLGQPYWALRGITSVELYPGEWRCSSAATTRRRSSSSQSRDASP
jgi:hypothetical protein